jgi:hypothetical protein
MSRWQKLRLVAAMPLANDLCHVPRLFKLGSNRSFPVTQSNIVPGKEDDLTMKTPKPDPGRVASGHHGSPRWRTNRRSHVEIGKSLSFRR